MGDEFNGLGWTLVAVGVVLIAGGGGVIVVNAKNWTRPAFISRLSLLKGTQIVFGGCALAFVGLLLLVRPGNFGLFDPPVIT